MRSGNSCYAQTSGSGPRAGLLCCTAKAHGAPRRRGGTQSATKTCRMKDLETSTHLETSTRGGRVQRSHEPALEPVEFATVKPENVRLSSRGLGWQPLN